MSFHGVLCARSSDINGDAWGSGDGDVVISSDAGIGLHRRDPFVHCRLL